MIEEIDTLLIRFRWDDISEEVFVISLIDVLNRYGYTILEEG